MLSNQDIAQYKQLKKEVDEANVEKQTMKAEIAVFKKQGLDKLKKYGYESYSDIPKLKELLDDLEKQVKEEKEQMVSYCTYMADKKAEKMAIFTKD